jgi:hypothetical protein
MSDEQQQAQKESQNILLVRPEDGVFETYSNFVDAVWTLFDITLRFAQIVPAPPGSGRPFDAIESAAVTVAWPEAKILRNILVDLVKRFEDTNGEIKPLELPPSPKDKPSL